MCVDGVGVGAAGPALAHDRVDVRRVAARDLGRRSDRVGVVVGGAARQGGRRSTAAFVSRGASRWSSGCDHATWAILGFLRPDPILGGNFATHFAIVPRRDYEIHDDWYVAGLNGTGSKTLLVDDVFVPEHRIESQVGLMCGLSKGFGSNDGEIFHTHFAHWFAMGFSAVSVGIARRFLEVYAEKVSTRVRAYTGANVGTTAPAYMRLAESHHQVRAAYATLIADWSAFTAQGTVASASHARGGRVLALEPGVRDEAGDRSRRSAVHRIGRQRLVPAQRDAAPVARLEDDRRPHLLRLRHRRPDASAVRCSACPATRPAF